MDFSYLAGLFDGDGTISMIKNRTPHINISQINKSLLNDIKSFLNYGTVEKVYDAYQDKNGYLHNTLYRIRFNRDEGIQFLKSIQPHLILKKERAQNALQRLEAGAKRKQRTGIPKGIRTQNPALYHRLYRRHKQGGIPPWLSQQKCSS